MLSYTQNNTSHLCVDFGEREKVQYVFSNIEYSDDKLDQKLVKMRRDDVAEQLHQLKFQLDSSNLSIRVGKRVNHSLAIRSIRVRGRRMNEERMKKETTGEVLVKAESACGSALATFE
jgi:hypothetical protein